MFWRGITEGKFSLAFIGQLGFQLVNDRNNAALYLKCVGDV
jgi:hypothetical protein